MVPQPVIDTLCRSHPMVTLSGGRSGWGFGAEMTAFEGSGAVLFALVGPGSPYFEKFSTIRSSS